LIIAVVLAIIVADTCSCDVSGRQARSGLIIIDIGAVMADCCFFASRASIISLSLPITVIGFSVWEVLLHYHAQSYGEEGVTKMKNYISNAQGQTGFPLPLSAEEIKEGKTAIEHRVTLFSKWTAGSVVIGFISIIATLLVLHLRHSISLTFLSFGFVEISILAIGIILMAIPFSRVGTAMSWYLSNTLALYLSFDFVTVYHPSR
jgi:hypothetical protein